MSFGRKGTRSDGSNLEMKIQSFSKQQQQVAPEDIKSLNLKLEDGSLVTSHAEKAHVLYTAYKNRMGTKSMAKLIQRMEGLECLSTIPTTEDLDMTIKNMPNDRAPGPHGFNGLFLN